MNCIVSYHIKIMRWNLIFWMNKNRITFCNVSFADSFTWQKAVHEEKVKTFPSTIEVKRRTMLRPQPHVWPGTNRIILGVFMSLRVFLFAWICASFPRIQFRGKKSNKHSYIIFHLFVYRLMEFMEICLALPAIRISLYFCYSILLKIGFFFASLHSKYKNSFDIQSKEFHADQWTHTKIETRRHHQQ